MRFFIRLHSHGTSLCVALLITLTSFFWIYTHDRKEQCMRSDATLPFQTTHVPTSRPVNQFEIPSHPFESGQPKLLVILAYQRSGSTFFGRLFNENPETFYIYEPLDSLYSSMYGTKQGWNVPTDITTYQNGTERVIPDFELERVSEFLRSLLLCNMDSLPTETLVHRYMFILANESSAMDEYIQCVQDKKYKKAVDKYYASILWRYCGHRFGLVSEERMTECRLMLTSQQYRQQHRTHNNITLFEKYLERAKELRRIINKNCLTSFSSACSRHNLRVTKIVRAAMDSMRPLLAGIPNFRVIHLIRDPRAVVLSRKNFPSSGGLFTEVDNNGSMVLEAKLYCRTVVSDIKTRLELEKIYPGKIYTIIYDDMVKNFKNYAENVYWFMDATIPYNTYSMINKIAANRRNSTKIAEKWKTVLTYQENADIWKDCEELYSLTNYNWPH